MVEQASLNAGRTVYRPLKRIICSVCGAQHTSEKKMRLCSACGEVAYCSERCQESDWKLHRKYCGKDKTDRVQLQSFYPLLALITNSARLLKLTSDDHPAFHHQIANNPDPRTEEIVECPNGEAAKLIQLGGPISLHEFGTPKWWPSAPSGHIRIHLARRIEMEGLLLPLMLAITVCLVGEMYTSTAIPSSERPEYQGTGKRRVRLTYRKSPISDFGIVSGITRVMARDRLVYHKLADGEWTMGQDPEDHYWLYFTTLSGEEVYLDCGLYTFNIATMVQTVGYNIYGIPDFNGAPAFWLDREAEKFFPAAARTQLQWKPRERFSVLRDKRLDDVLRPNEVAEGGLSILYSFMDEIARRSCTEWEKKMFKVFLTFSSRILRLTMRNRDYLRFPQQPKTLINLEPGEIDSYSGSEYGKVHLAYLKNLRHKLETNQITKDQWTDAFAMWTSTPFEEQKKIMKRFK